MIFSQINSGSGGYPFSEFAETSFGAGFQEPELVIAQPHFGADALLGLL
jgi:hypothetical protein